MPLPLDLAHRPEERVLRQLVSALLFEGLIEPDEFASSHTTRFEWWGGRHRLRCLGRRGPFGRARLQPGSIEMLGAEGGWLQADIQAIASGLNAPLEQSERLVAELEQTIAFCRWNEENLSRPLRREMDFQDLEGTLDEGHPYHPCFKARTGFDLRDHAAYGPEAGASFQLEWLFVARAHLHQSLPVAEDAFWLGELGEETWSGLCAVRRRLEIDPDTFALLPLHPWQWRRLKRTVLAPWIADGLIHSAGPTGDFYRASQSVRSLLNVTNPAKASVKLSMDMVNTSSLRTLDAHSVCTAPAISDWVSRTVAGDPLFRERYPLVVLREYAGMIADRSGPLAGQLGAIWRESADTKLGPGERAVPFAALMTVEADGKPFIDHWVTRYGIPAWLDRLVEVAVMPVWHLLVAHGIGTEAHGQNMVLVHRDGWPVRLILRDFHDSLEYVPDFLADPARAPDFEALNPIYRQAKPDEFYWMENVEALRELAIDTLFVFNLTEVSHLLEVCHGFSEIEFWRRVANRLDAYATEHRLQERQARIGHSTPQLFAESLLTRKFFPGRAQYRHPIPNIFDASVEGSFAA